MSRKQYLGDSVYADFNGREVILTTENGCEPELMYRGQPILTSPDELFDWAGGTIEEANHTKGNQ